MNAERLQQLRRVVEALPDDRLHMRSWCEEATCGTAYCAAGAAAVDPWFRANTTIAEIFVVDVRGHVTPREYAGPTLNRLSELFDIRQGDAARLFAITAGWRLGPHAIAKAEVLANIDRLLVGRPAEAYAAITAAITARAAALARHAY